MGYHRACWRQRRRWRGAHANGAPHVAKIFIEFAMISIGGGGKISLVEENEYQFSIVVGHQGALGYVNDVGSGMSFWTGLNLGLQFDAGVGQPGFLLRLLYTPTIGVTPAFWGAFLGGSHTIFSSLASYQIILGGRVEPDWALSLAWAHTVDGRGTIAVSVQTDYLF